MRDERFGEQTDGLLDGFERAMRASYDSHREHGHSEQHRGEKEMSQQTGWQKKEPILMVDCDELKSRSKEMQAEWCGLSRNYRCMRRAKRCGKLNIMCACRGPKRMDLEFNLKLRTWSKAHMGGNDLVRVVAANVKP